MLWLHTQFAVQRIGNLLANVQAQSVALQVKFFALLARGLEIRLEQIFLVLLADANAIVCNTNAHIGVAVIVWLNLQLDFDFLFDWRELDSIGKEIDDDLLQSCWVSYNLSVWCLVAKLNLDLL